MIKERGEGEGVIIDGGSNLVELDFFWRRMKRKLKDMKMMVMLKVEIGVMEVALW